MVVGFEVHGTEPQMTETGHPERGIAVSVHWRKRVPECSQMGWWVSSATSFPHRPPTTARPVIEWVPIQTHTYTDTPIPHGRAETALQPSIHSGEVWSDSQGVLGNPYNWAKVVPASPSFSRDLSFPLRPETVCSSEKIAKKCCLSSPQDCHWGKGGSPVQWKDHRFWNAPHLGSNPDFTTW